MVRLFRCSCGHRDRVIEELLAQAIGSQLLPTLRIMGRVRCPKCGGWMKEAKDAE